MKKKLMTLLLASALMISACETPNTSTDNGSSGNATSTDAEETIDSVIKTEGTTESPSSTQAQPMAFEEMIVVDNDQCTIKITGIEPDNMWGYSLNAQLENKSADKTYMFSLLHTAVNGVQCDTLFATEVAAGKKSNKDISFIDSALEENGITDFTDIELTFRVYDNNDWTAEDVANTTVHVYPYGQENATIFTREPQPSDNILIDNEYVTVIATGYEDDDIWGYMMNLFLVNKTDKEIMFSVEEASVNGYMADPFYATSVLPGKCAFSSISWSNTTLEENSITEVESIEFLLNAYDSNDWMADSFVNTQITVTP